MNNSLLSYLPPVLQSISELRKICEIEESEFLACEVEMENVWQNQFVESANENGLSRFEKICGITPRGTDTISDRRFRIKNRVMGDLPYTKKALMQKLIALCDTNGFSLMIDSRTYTVEIKLELTAKNQMDEVEHTLLDILPANMIVEVSIRYNQYAAFGGYTHGRLAAKTQEQMRNEVL